MGNAKEEAGKYFSPVLHCFLHNVIIREEKSGLKKFLRIMVFTEEDMSSSAILRNGTLACLLLLTDKTVLRFLIVDFLIYTERKCGDEKNKINNKAATLSP